MRYFGIVLGILVCLGAGWALRWQDQIPSLAEDLRQDAASPYRWADFGDAALAAGKPDEARRAYEQALQLGPATPQLWIRAANLYFQLNEIRSGVRYAASALGAVNAYDDILFSYFDNFGVAPAFVLEEIGKHERAVRAYTTHLIALGNFDGAESAWRYLHTKDNHLTSMYIDGLIRTGRYDVASHFGCVGICNGGFENEPSGSALDWRILPSEKFETARERGVAHSGTWSLRIRFRGTENVSYANVQQAVFLRPGKHRLQAWVRAEGISTEEGPRVEILNARTEPITGTHDWTRLELPFVAPPGTSMAEIRVVRLPSLKFDNRIDGTLWLDSFSLE